MEMETDMEMEIEAEMERRETEGRPRKGNAGRGRRGRRSQGETWRFSHRILLRFDSATNSRPNRALYRGLKDRSLQVTKTHHGRTI